MTDRELLERAAKAAGYAVIGWDNALPDTPIVAGDRYGHGTTVKWVWMPLVDDGDALRLAVDLQLDVYVRGEWIEAVGPMGAPQKVHYNGADARRDAARLAIVRAAAAMVKP